LRIVIIPTRIEAREIGQVRGAEAGRSLDCPAS
jgi:hypothetical protein